MAADESTWIRPRGQAWGDEAQRAVLHAIAEDVARRSGYKVAAIEALRSDGNLEFVAIAGSPEARAQLLGQAAPLRMERIVAFGTRMGGWIHVPEERIDDETREWMAQYGHTPDLPESGLADAWRAEDRLVRLLENADGELRATLYLDEPLDGLRPTPASIATLNAEIGPMFDAVVSVVERELYGEQVRMLAQARAARQSVPPGLGVTEFLDELAKAMVARMPVDFVDLHLSGQAAPALEPDTDFFDERIRGLWQERGHLVVEPDQTWGVDGIPTTTHPLVRDDMRRRGVGSWLVMPIGRHDEYLGAAGIGRREGGVRWVDSEINALAAVASDIAAVVVDARTMERERQLNAELRDLNDYRRDMVNTLAHELRNPVSVMFTHLELLEQTGLPEAAQGSLAAMHRASRRIEDMVEDLMALASISDSQRPAPREPVDFSALVRECCAFLEPTAAAAGVELVTDIERGLVVPGDAASLPRLVANLVSNAIKYTPGGGRVSVGLVTEEHAGAVRLDVTDTGIGIDPAEIGQVFTPFFRSARPEARIRPGTGLGLAISQRVVRLHEGTVDIASVLGEGTTFTVRLPLAPPADVR